MIHLPALDFVSVCDESYSQYKYSKPAKGTTIVSWLQQSYQQRSYLRKYKNYHLKTQCVHKRTNNRQCLQKKTKYFSILNYLFRNSDLDDEVNLFLREIKDRSKKNIPFLFEVSRLNIVNIVVFTWVF
jgi:predicted restriction endonuclease